MSFFPWLTPLSIIPSKSIHFAVNGKFSCFWWMSNTPLYIFTTSYLFICWTFISCSHILAMIDNAAMNIEVQRSFWNSIYIFFRYIPRSGTAGIYCISIFSFLRYIHNGKFPFLSSFRNNSPDGLTVPSQLFFPSMFSWGEQWVKNWSLHF